MDKDRRYSLTFNLPLNSDDWLVVHNMLSGSHGGLPPVDTFWRDDALAIFTDDLLNPFTTDS